MSLYDTHNRLAGVHPKLAEVVKLAAQDVDIIVIEGVRTAERQAQLYAQGRTAPGNVVTWVKVSNHQVKNDGLGHAVDLGARKADGSIDWNNPAAYLAIYKAMFHAAQKVDLKPYHLRAGSDWDGDGVRHEHGETDDPHFELHL